MTSQSQDASGVTQDPTPAQPEAAQPAKPGLDPRGLLQMLQEVSITFREYRPVVLRIHKAVAERFPEIDRKLIRSAMRTHTASTPYLKAMEKATHRLDLDGNACAEVAEEHRAHAAQTLKEESIDLIPPAGRSFANYRLYSDADLHRLRFIKRARTLGFPMKEIAQVLGLWSDPQRSSSEVKKLAQSHADALGRKIAEMQAMQRTLADLAQRCHGDDRPDCPILDDLSRTEEPDRHGKPSACH